VVTTGGHAAPEGRLAAIIESSADAIIGMTPGGVITSWNPGAQRLYGYSAGEAIGLSITTLMLPERSREEAAIVERVARGARIDQYETERMKKDGTRVEVSLSVSPIKAPDGGVVAVSTVERDITDRKRAVEALLGAEARFERAFNDAPIGMALVSIEPGRLGHLLQVNAALCALTGHSSRDLEATDFQSLTYPGDLEGELALLADVIAGDIQRYEIEKRLIHAEHDVFWVLSTVSLVRHASGAPLHCILQVQDIQERKRFEGHLEYLADHDVLTGLSNRRRFERELERQLSFAHRYGGDGALLLIDIDNFKDVNDTLGHHAGDEIITSVAHLLRERMRESDILARLGGDEFAVLLPNADGSDASAFARDTMEVVREAPISAGERRTHITASVGIALFAVDKKQSAEDLMIDADLAMYDAKDAGRDLVVLSTQEHHTRFEARLTGTERIRNALDEDLFTLYSQPILDLRTGDVQQHELLLRMAGPRGELALPASFIYTAERSGLIQAIDRWVVGRAIQLIADRERIGRELRLEVNISGRSVTDAALLDFIERELGAAAVDPGRLIIELTETAAIANMDQARKFVERLRDIGCRFALDDFGAGFGSFYYLKHLPPDYLKIDGEFVRDLPSSATDQTILRSIVQMAQGLDKQTIAEFVGSEETIELLREHGVDYAQGYHVAPPRPVSTVHPAGRGRIESDR
jgi:diguanylate cyclase (GGDEF)-like protein/PAS domain S-box-containing protein